MEETIRREPFKSRIHEIDLVRGILMVLVMLDHILNLLMSFGETWAGPDRIPQYWAIYEGVLYIYWINPARIVVKYIVLFGFCFLSGISCAFSRDNWRKTGLLMGLWALILFVSNTLESFRTTYNLQVGVRTFRVDFNIIGVIAFSNLFYCFFQKKSWKWHLVIGIIGLLLHPVCVILSKTDWGQSFYSIPFWKPNRVISDQADFLSIFPYLGYFFGGVILSKFTYAKERKSYFKQYNWERPFCFVGRHSLLFYGTHFFVFIGIFLIIGLFIK